MRLEEARPVSGWDAPYQLALVAAILEGLAVLALAPRVAPAEPHAYAAVSGMRAAAMVGLGLLVRPARPRAVLPAMLAWAGLTLPPVLWAWALEGGATLPLASALGGAVYGAGAYGLARLAPRLWPLGLAAVGLGLLLPARFNPFAELLGAGPPIWSLLALALALAAWRREEGPPWRRR